MELAPSAQVEDKAHKKGKTATSRSRCFFPPGILSGYPSISKRGEEILPPLKKIQNKTELKWIPMDRLHLLHPNRPFLFISPPKASPPIVTRWINPTQTTGRRMNVTCMANPRRVKMVASQIHRQISDMLITDKVLQEAIMPEFAFGADDYLSSVTTISDVQVSGDLQVVKVYVSVFGDDRGKKVAMAGLKSKARYVRSQLGRRMSLRKTPEVRFYDNEGSERGSRVIEILDRIKAKKGKENAENVGEQQSVVDDPLEDDEWDYDGPEEDIIFVK